MCHQRITNALAHPVSLDTTATKVLTTAYRHRARTMLFALMGMIPTLAHAHLDTPVQTARWTQTSAYHNRVLMAEHVQTHPLLVHQLQMVCTCAYARPVSPASTVPRTSMSVNHLHVSTVHIVLSLPRSRTSQLDPRCLSMCHLLCSTR
jgi:hypothetical protein